MSEFELVDEQIIMGSVVKLNSGGPFMTVEKLNHNHNDPADVYDVVYCTWFDATDRRCFGMFNRILLRSYA